MRLDAFVDTLKVTYFGYNEVEIFRPNNALAGVHE